MGNAILSDEFDNNALDNKKWSQLVIDREIGLSHNILTDDIPREVLLIIYSHLGHSEVLRMCCLNDRMAKIMKADIRFRGARLQTPLTSMQFV